MVNKETAVKVLDVWRSLSFKKSHEDVETTARGTATLTANLTSRSPLRQSSKKQDSGDALVQAEAGVIPRVQSVRFQSKMEDSFPKNAYLYVDHVPY